MPIGTLLPAVGRGRSIPRLRPDPRARRPAPRCAGSVAPDVNLEERPHETHLWHLVAEPDRRRGRVGILAAGPAAAQKTELLVYTALETDQIKAYEEGFKKANPNIDIKWVRDSTGVITAKLLAEKANPQADLVVGTSASSLAVFANEGMLQPYAPKGLDKISPQYRDPKNPPEWVGMDVYGATICFNTVEAAKLGLPKPETWKDLTKPVYKGKIVMPNPASSGTGYLDVAGWLQMWGEADALEVHGRAAREHRAVHALRQRSRAGRPAPASSRSASRSSTAR